MALEAIASVHGRAVGARSRSNTGGSGPAPSDGGTAAAATSDLATGLDEVVLGLGSDVAAVQRKQYTAYRRLRNFVCVPPVRHARILADAKVDPKGVDLVPGFTRDVTGLGHHGTGDLEVQLRSERDLERAADLFRLAYTGA
ncbi:DUF5655 domain-containing protein [Streptomyces sp. NPDC004610]|uniref:DUF5655 domain-containing protein n=1 Tax=unclassified Streptomyces TaxID=2593676 RepID=UPI00339E17D4